MFVKHSCCFHVLCSSKTSFTFGVSVSPLEKPENKQRRILEVPSNGVEKKFGSGYKQSSDRRNEGGGGVDECGLIKPSLEKNQDGVRRIIGGENGGGLKKKEVGAKVCRGKGNYGLVEKVHSRCSTKWASYGGCIPAILQALETFKDVDEALRPWEEKLNNKERSIILKEQMVWERALEIFEWFKKKGCYELNVIHYNIMLRTLGKARKWGHVESLWDEMMVRGIAPINSTFGTLIDVYSKGGQKDVALVWLGKMSKQGMEPDEVTMGIVVQMYKKAGEFKKADEFFKKWSSGESLNAKLYNASHAHVSLSSHTFNTLIDTYGKAGQLEEASKTFARMLREGIVPTTVTFNTMIHICGNNGQLDEVSSLIQKMVELRCPPDTRTYNILISLHTKHDDIHMAAGYFRKMKESRLEPDLVSYRTLLYAYSIRHMVIEAEKLVSEMDERDLEIDEFTQSALTRMYIEAGMLEKSWLWFSRFHVAGNMSSECYSANIDAYGERGHILEAEKVFNCWQERKKPSVLEFNVMIKAYGIGKNYNLACQLFDSMEIHGVLPDKCSYSSLIQILASADLPETAVPYLRKMQDSGLVNDCIPYCAVISSFIKLGWLEMAEGLYNEMIGNDVQPDIIVYGVLINAFADSGSVKEAISYFNAMRTAGLAGNTVIYNSLIKLYTKVGYLKEAEEIYQMLQSLKAGPDIYTSNCMIDLYSERSMFQEAEEIFGYLKKKGVANEFSYAMMLCMYKRMGRLEEAICIAQKMRELGLLTDLLSYNNVLGLYASNGRFKEAVGTFKEMMEASIQPDECTVRSLGVVLVKCGISKKAVGNLEIAWKKNARSGLQALISILSSVVLMEDDGA